MLLDNSQVVAETQHCLPLSFDSGHSISTYLLSLWDRKPGMSRARSLRQPDVRHGFLSGNISLFAQRENLQQRQFCSHLIAKNCLNNKSCCLGFTSERQNEMMDVPGPSLWCAVIPTPVTPTHKDTIELEIELQRLSKEKQAVLHVPLTLSWGCLASEGRKELVLMERWVPNLQKDPSNFCGVERSCVSFCPENRSSRY